MAAAAPPAEGLLASRSGRALAFASSFTVCLLAAGALSITLMGRPRPPAVLLDLPALAPHHAAASSAPAAHMPARTDDAPIAPPITHPIFAGGQVVADPALIENTPQGPLPRIADDGRKPMSVYAGTAPTGAKFRIAIVVTGLGLSASQTKAALDALPKGVTLAFAPYAGDVGNWASQARGHGHEVLLEIPMEPFDFPDSDPGPHTLRAGQDDDSNMQRLNWALSRFTGYAGVTNLLGQRFLSDSNALAPFMTALNRRGLYFLDGGSASQSVAPQVAGQVGLPAAQASEVDTIQSALEIDRRLADLETQARAHGSAVGTAFLYPVSVARIAAWAKGLRARGFDLVPVSAIIPAPK